MSAKEEAFAEQQIVLEKEIKTCLDIMDRAGYNNDQRAVTIAKIIGDGIQSAIDKIRYDQG